MLVAINDNGVGATIPTSIFLEELSPVTVSVIVKEYELVVAVVFGVPCNTPGATNCNDGKDGI